jgi:hypothetical protein
VVRASRGEWMVKAGGQVLSCHGDVEAARVARRQALRAMIRERKVQRALRYANAHRRLRDRAGGERSA